MTSDAYRWRPEENLSPMDPRVNTQVKAVQRAEAIIRHAWVRLAAADAVLFDPALVPELAERVDVAAAEYHALAAEGALRYETHDGDADYNPDAMYEQGAVKFWHVGSARVFVARDRWHDSPTRHVSTTTYAGGLLSQDVGLHHYWDCRIHDCEEHCDLRCTVHFAKSCGGPTRLLPVDRGTLVLLYRICKECEVLAGEIADNTRKTTIVQARTDLPPGAVIMPNPEPDEHPAAWA